MAKAKTYDVWLTTNNSVYKQVPYLVVTDWVQQSRLGPEDKVKPSGTEHWIAIADEPLFSAYLPFGEEDEILEEDQPRIELDFQFKKKQEDEDDDVDMIPLIDISLVLLIFFMMTTTVAAIANIAVPEMNNATKVESATGTLTIYMDWKNNAIEYGLGIDTSAPVGENANVTELTLQNRLDTLLSGFTQPAKIRIEAHKDIPYKDVDRVMQSLDQRKKKGVAISHYVVGVAERFEQ